MQNESKNDCNPKNESQIKSFRVLITEWHDRTKDRLQLKWPVQLKWPFQLAQNFFRRCEMEMIDLPRSVASSGEAMYQSAFMSLEFRLNTGKKCACIAWPS